MVSCRLLIAGIAFVAASIVAAMGPVEIREALERLRREVESLQPIAESIKPGDDVLLANGTGPFPLLLNRFSDVFSVFQTTSSQIGASPPVSSTTDLAQTILSEFYTVGRTGEAIALTLLNQVSDLEEHSLAGTPVADALQELLGKYLSCSSAIVQLMENDDITEDILNTNTDIMASFNAIIDVYRERATSGRE